MGVTLWYSRCEIPGAAASPAFDFGENTVTKEGASGSVKSAADILSSLTAIHVPEKRTPEPKASAILAVVTTNNSIDHKSHILPELAEVIEPPVSPAFDGFPPSIQANETKQERVDELALMLWVGEHYWFLSDNDSEFPDTLRRQLLLNIASSIGEKVEEAKVINFNWPFFGNRRLPGNDRASMLSLLFEWISSQLVSDELTGILMGEKLAHFLLQEPLSKISDMNGQKTELSLSDERGVMVMPTLSLNDLLRTPSHKKQVWQHLKQHYIK